MATLSRCVIHDDEDLVELNGYALFAVAVHHPQSSTFAGCANRKSVSLPMPRQKLMDEDFEGHGAHRVGDTECDRGWRRPGAAGTVGAEKGEDTE